MMLRRSRWMHVFVVTSACLCLIWMMSGAASAAAEPTVNEIQAISSVQSGDKVEIRLALKHPLTVLPDGFVMHHPARIVLDLPDTTNAMGINVQEIGLSGVQRLQLVQAGERSRLIFNLKRPLAYATRIDGHHLIITIGADYSDVTETVLPMSVHQQLTALNDLAFRRGGNGEGRVIIDLPNQSVMLDVRRKDKVLDVVLPGTVLPAALRRRL